MSLTAQTPTHALLHNHYRDVRRRLMGKPHRQLSLPAPEPKPIDRSLAIHLAWVAKEEEKARQLELKQQKIADMLLMASAKYNRVNLRESTRQIIKRIAEKHGFTSDDLTGTSRKYKVIEARFEAIDEVNTLWPEKGWCEIGRIFKRDHSSVISALKKRGTYKKKLPARTKA